jgi:peptidyl-prolyl cis-trans isomerase B (cyclophilin B)
VPTNKQRREAARRHLERQLQRRIESDVKRKRRNLILTIVSSVVLVLVVVGAMILFIGDGDKSPAASGSSDTPSATPSTTGPPAPKTAGPCGYTQDAQPATKDVGFPPDPSPTPTTNRVVTFDTNKGKITMNLDASLAPCNVQSIAYLATKGYYDGVGCHRLTTTGIYVLQCGDPAGNGTGGPGYETKDENLSKADYSKPGVVAMANAGPNTGGSQFFIIYQDSSAGLTKAYTQIGTITAGMDIVQQVVAGGSDGASGAGDGKPNVALTFTKVTVVPVVEGSGTMVTPVPTAPVASTPAASTPAASTPAASSTAPSS